MSRFLLLILFPVALVCQTRPPATGSVEGRVTNSQTADGVAGATLSLSRRPTPSAPAGTVRPTTSQSDGSFRFEGVENGRFLITAVRSGFSGIDAPVAFQFISVGAGQQITGVALQLVPQGSISGRVLDEDGNPVGGHVEAFTAHVSLGNIRLHQASSANISDTGEYVLQNLAFGKYFLAAEPDDPPTPNHSEQSRLELVRTFYPNALVREIQSRGTAVNVQERAHLQIQLRLTASDEIRETAARLGLTLQ